MTSQGQMPFRIYNAGAEVRAFFDERFPCIEFDAVQFDLNRLALALFSSTYRSPIPLLFGREHTCGDVLSSDIAMTVELVHAMYGINEDTEPLAAAYETPEWYLRGMASFTDRKGTPRIAPMHVFLLAPEGPLERANVQIVCDPKLYTLP